ncbi:PREDICTED: glutamate receptor 2.8-like [Populus euphratica]|uniref:Glutamate receptor n=1 Tax=Populus euphratica TaxID=75702 RepID=A0AAJ6X955_POPEU|nr:PREDICTED: glutamate receptor 2.8-like [Populus euphratica]
MNKFNHMIFSFFALTFLFMLKKTAAEGVQAKGINIGAIIDMSSRIGKEQRVAMEIAMEDFYGTGNQTLVLHIRDSQRDPVCAAVAAMDLINNQQVQAILGPQTWEEALSVAEISSQTQVPILSLSDTTPKWATERWPYLLQASPSKLEQMKAIAAIVQSGNWHQFTVIYEGTDSAAIAVTPYLFNALRDAGVGVIQGLILPTFASAITLSEELEKLKSEQSRVFVVHLSFPLAVRLFEKAKKMKMMEKDYVWITTNPVTSLVHSNASIISSSMQGIIGVKSYFPERGHLFHEIRQRFRRKFSIENPKDDNNEPGIYAAEAYDAVWTMAVAVNGSNRVGQELLETILQVDFHGLSGKVQFVKFINERAPANRFHINIIGKSYKEIGFWSKGLGFSKTIHENSIYSSCMTVLEQALWPEGRWHTSRGWTLATSANPWRIGVPGESGYREFVHVEYDHLGNSVAFSGFAIEVFKETIRRLPFILPYEFIAFKNTSYDELLKQILLKKYDAVVGDVVILASRYQLAEFTKPYTETGLMLIVPAQSGNRELSFIRPFTKSMWVLIAVITVYNGFIIWLIERNHCPSLKGSMLHQIGIMLWLAFNTLFSLHGGKMHSNLSRMSMVVWLFVALVITETYTANLSSMLTVQKLDGAAPNVEALLNSNAVVGYCTGSYLQNYLVDVLRFKTQNIRNYTTQEAYAQAFKNKEIAAVFLEVPLAKLFLAKYCRRFVSVGPTYKVGGFGFAFPRGSPLLPSIDEALLKVSENGTLLELENRLIKPGNCPDVEDEKHSLSPSSFGTLFIITTGTSTISLAIYIFSRGNPMLGYTTIWRLMLAAIRFWVCQRQITRRSSNAENSVNNLAPQASGMQSLV